MLLPHPRLHNLVRAGALACALAAGLTGGCTPLWNRARPGPSAETIDAIETREVGAGQDQVLRAATTVLLDEGYAYCMSDHAAGLISGFRLRNDTMSSEYYARGGGMSTVTGGCGCCATPPGSMYDTTVYNSTPRSAIGDSVAIWVRPAGRSRSLVRIQIWSGGGWLIDEQSVTQFSSLIERRLLAGAPSASAPQASGARP